MYVTDIDGRTYLDCMAGFSAVNQGHAHPKIVAALSEQASKLGLVSRGLFSEAFPAYAKYITGVFGYDKVRLDESPREDFCSATAHARLAAGAARVHRRGDGRDGHQARPPLVRARRCGLGVPCSLRGFDGSTYSGATM